MKELKRVVEKSIKRRASC